MNLSRLFILRPIATALLMVAILIAGLMAYRLQARAWKDVEAGRIEEATQRLQMAGTRLFGAGEQELARTVQDEATRLLRSGSASEEGRKRIKFGTRGLMGPADEQAAGA